MGRQASNHPACPGVPPKWHTILYNSVLLLTRALGSWPKVVHYKGNRAPFGTHILEMCAWKCNLVEMWCDYNQQASSSLLFTACSGSFPGVALLLIPSEIHLENYSSNTYPFLTCFMSTFPCSTSTGLLKYSCRCSGIKYSCRCSVLKYECRCSVLKYSCRCSVLKWGVWSSEVIVWLIWQ